LSSATFWEVIEKTRKIPSENCAGIGQNKHKQVGTWGNSDCIKSKTKQNLLWKGGQALNQAAREFVDFQSLMIFKIWQDKALCNLI